MGTTGLGGWVLILVTVMQLGVGCTAGDGTNFRAPPTMAVTPSQVGAPTEVPRPAPTDPLGGAGVPAVPGMVAAGMNAATGTAGSGGILPGPAMNGGVAGTGGVAGSGGGDEPQSMNCPAGFESELPLVLTSDTVPGNVGLGLAASPETARNPCGSPEEQACFWIANEHRVAAGLQPFKWDGDLADLARSHAADRTQLGYYNLGAHGSSTQLFLHLYQERADFLGLKSGKFTSVVENSHSGPRTGAAVMDGFMNSSAHRDVIMGAGNWRGLTHAACGQDGAEWNMEFGQVGW